MELNWHARTEVERPGAPIIPGQTTSGAGELKAAAEAGEVNLIHELPVHLGGVALIPPVDSYR